MKFKSEVQLEALNNATVDTDKFLVSDSSTVKYRTGAQLLSDLGIAGTYVPYTGATGNVDLGTHTLSSYNLIVNHTSGSGVAASITKGGSGEALTINKTSGSGNAMSVTGGLTSLVDLTLSSIANATIDTDRFIVSDSGAIKYRTGAQVLSDIGGQSALTNPITGTGTTNYISKFTGSTTLGNSLLFDNGTNVGIGTTAPYSKFTTLGALSTSTSQISIVNSEGGHTILRTGISGISNAGFSLISADVAGTNQNTRLVVNSSGNVGIGTTNPVSKLDLGTSGALRVTQAGITEVYVEGTGVRLKNIYPSGGWARGILTYENSTGTDYFQLGGYGSGQTFIYGYLGASYDNNALRWYPNNNVYVGGNLGVGTTSPGDKLQVFGGGVTSQSLNAIGSPSVFTGTGGITTSYASSVGSIRAYSNSSGTGTAAINFITAGTEKVRITNAGNVGIGTTAPSSKLHVYHNDTGIGTDTGITIEQAGPGNAILQYLQTGVYRWVTGIDNSDGDKFKIGRGFSWSIGQDFTIDTSGNVGIGNTSPGTKLHVGTGSGATADTAYQIVADSSGISGIQVLSGTTQSGRIVFGDSVVNNSGMIKYDHSSDSMTFNTSATEKLRITSTGNVGIGTTSPTFSAGSGLQVVRSDYANVRVTGGSSIGLDLLQSSDGTGYLRNRDNAQLRLGTNNVDVITMTNGGNVGIGTTSPAVKLHLLASSENEVRVQESTNNAFISLYQQAATSYLIAGRTGSTPTQDLSIYTGGGEKMRITSAGKVGIGTTSPQSPLQVGNYTFSGGYARGTVATFAGAWSSTLPTLTLISTDTTSTQNKGGSIAFAGGSEASSTPYTFAQIKGLKELTGGTYSGYMGFYTTPAGSNQNTERMRITSTGNVGIGTTSPSQKLHVVGNAIVTGSANIQSDLDVGGDTIMTGKVSVTAVGPQEISAALEVTSTTQGFLPPRMKEGERDSISSPATGLMIFNTDSFTVEVFDGSDWRSLAWV